MYVIIEVGSNVMKSNGYGAKCNEYEANIIKL